MQEQQIAEQLIEALLRDPPAGMTTAQVAAWIRSHSAALGEVVRRACRERSRGHYYAVADTWYVDSRLLQSVMEHHEALPVEADWRVLLPVGGLRCHLVADRARLPDQVGPLFMCKGEGSTSPQELLQAWGERDDLAVLGGRWDTWPGAVTSACGSSCACTGCSRELGHHDHTPSSLKATPQLWVAAFADKLRTYEPDHDSGIFPDELADTAWNTWTAYRTRKPTFAERGAWTDLEYEFIEAFRYLDDELGDPRAADDFTRLALRFAAQASKEGP